MNISLPEQMREWVEERVAAEGYGTASEYIRDLIRQEQRREAQEHLDRKLIDAIDSGDAVEMTSKDWEHIRSSVRARLAAKGKGRG